MDSDRARRVKLSDWAELFAAASLEFFLGVRPRFFDRCPYPQHNAVFHFPDDAHDSRPDIVADDRLVDVGIVTDPQLRASIVNADQKIDTAKWHGRYSWRVFVPLSYDRDGKETYSKAMVLKQQCLRIVGALEACLAHGPVQAGGCPAGQDFLCLLLQGRSPLGPGGFSSDGWHFYAEESPVSARHVDMLPMWSRNAHAGDFVRKIESTVKGAGPDPSDIAKKFERFRDPRISHREVFFVPELDFLSAARLDVLTHDLAPGAMPRFITGVYVASPGLGGVAHWRRQPGTTWDFKPFPDDFDPQFHCLES